MSEFYFQGACSKHGPQCPPDCSYNNIQVQGKNPVEEASSQSGGYPVPPKANRETYRDGDFTPAELEERRIENVISDRYIGEVARNFIDDHGESYETRTKLEDLINDPSLQEERERLFPGWSEDELESLYMDVSHFLSEAGF